MLLSNFIVVTDYTHGRILQVNLLTGTVVKLPITTKKSPGLAFDKSTKTLFYCELLTNSIKYTTLQGETQPISTQQVSSSNLLHYANVICENELE